MCFAVPKLKEAYLDPAEVTFRLSETLLPYMMPHVIITDNIPLLTNGKTDRQKLLESYKLSTTQSEK